MVKALGLTKGTVSKLVAKGMPLDSVEAAQAWRAAHAAEGVGHKSHSDSIADSARSISPKRPGGAFTTAPDDPAGTLARMRETEQRVYALIDAALKKAKETQRPDDYAAIPGLLRSYNQAGANALDAAAAWERHCRKSGQVAPVEHLLNVLTARLEPLAAQLDNFPASVAALANPADPAVAERAITTALVALRRQLAAAVDPIPPAPAEP
jgi:hypothetical protein